MIVKEAGIVMLLGGMVVMGLYLITSLCSLMVKCYKTLPRDVDCKGLNICKCCWWHDGEIGLQVTTPFAFTEANCYSMLQRDRYCGGLVHCHAASSMVEEYDFI